MNLPAVEGLQFLRPLWLLGLLALPLIAWAWQARARRRSAWRASVDAHLLPHLLERGGSGRARWPWLALAGLALACIALAGPSWRRAEQPLWQARAPLVIALDLSAQALAGDLPPSRLLQARAKIDALLKARRGGQVALVTYADDAYTVAPLTDDVANIALFLDALHPDIMPSDSMSGNSGPEDAERHAHAIERATRLLRQAGFDRGDILLLTGGAGEQADAAASRAAADGYRVSVLGLGSAKGAAYRRIDGSLGQARLDAQSLRALARAGDGAYAALQPGLGDLETLGVLDPQRAGARAARGQKSTLWLDQGYWLLPPLLLLGALAFRRGAAFAVLLLCLALPPLPARAQDSPAPRAQAAQRDGQGTLWRRPDQQAHARTQRGAQAYRKGDYAAAATAFDGVTGADGAYNAGNALARQGRYEDAVAAYDRALRAQPGMADAVANRKAVLDAMKRKPPQGANRNQPNPRSDQAGQSQSRPGQQGKPSDGNDAQQQDAKQQNEGKQADGQQRSATRGQRPPPDAERQRAADAAQRQRMQRALERRQAESGQQIEGRPDRAEQAARRERSQANAALLRRVPDDPGALLRAKFELEYERRQAQGED